MKEKKIIVLAGIFLLTAAVLFYFKEIFLPIKFKHIVEKKAQEFLRRPTSIGELHFSIIEGLILKDIRVFSRETPHQPFLFVKKTSLKILFTPFLKSKQVVISSLKIEKPFVHLIRQDSAVWNFSDLLTRKNGKEKRSLPLIWGEIAVSNATVRLTDRTPGREFSESISGVNLRAAPSLGKIIKISWGAQIPQIKSLLKADGFYDLTTEKFSSKMILENINAARYFPFFSAKSSLQLKTGVITAAAFDLTYHKKRLDLLGNAEVVNITLILGEGREMAGHLTIIDGSLNWQPGKWAMNGSLLMPAARLTLAPDKDFQGNLTAKLQTVTILDGRITAKGDVTLNNAAFVLGSNKTLKGNILATGAELASTADGLDLTAVVKMENAALALGGGNLSGEVFARETRLSYKNQTLFVETQMSFNDAEMKTPTGLILQGSPNLTLSSRFSLQDQPSLRYEGTLDLRDATLKGIPHLSTAEKLDGKILFQTGMAQTEALTFKAYNSEFRLTGRITDPANPLAEITATSDNIDLEKMAALFPALSEKNGIHLKGLAGIKAAYQGPVKSPDSAGLKVTAQLREAGVTSKKMVQGITGIQGQIDFAKDLISWKNLEGIYGGRSYRLNGRVNNFSRPILLTSLTSDALSLTADLRILHSAFRIVSLQGKFFTNDFDLKGDVHWAEDTGPLIDLRGTFNLDLETLTAMAPALKEKIDPWKPKGRIAVEGLYRGRPQDWRNWDLTLKILAPSISLIDLSFNDVGIQITQRDRHISKFNILSKVYGGELNLISSIDLTKTDLPANATCQMTNLNLAHLRRDKKLKNKRLAGNLSFLVNAKGPLLYADQLTGDGTLSVTEGYLYEWNLLKGIFSLLLIPEFNDIVFTDALADFTIREGKIHTKNAEMSSKIVNLEAEGWVDYSKNIHLNIRPEFSEIGILQSKSLKKGPTAFLTQIINIQCDGTLNTPQCSIDKSIPHLIGNTTDMLKEGVKGVLDEIF